MRKLATEREGWATSTGPMEHYYRAGKPICNNRFAKSRVFLAPETQLQAPCGNCKRRLPRSG